MEQAGGNALWQVRTEVAIITIEKRIDERRNAKGSKYSHAVVSEKTLNDLFINELQWVKRMIAKEMNGLPGEPVPSTSGADQARC
jgi:hypothetical protein